MGKNKEKALTSNACIWKCFTEPTKKENETHNLMNKMEEHPHNLINYLPLLFFIFNTIY